MTTLNTTIHDLTFESDCSDPTPLIKIARCMGYNLTSGGSQKYETWRENVYAAEELRERGRQSLARERQPTPPGCDSVV